MLLEVLHSPPPASPPPSPVLVGEESPEGGRPASPHPAVSLTLSATAGLLSGLAVPCRRHQPYWLADSAVPALKIPPSLLFMGVPACPRGLPHRQAQGFQLLQRPAFEQAVRMAVVFFLIDYFSPPKASVC